MNTHKGTARTRAAERALRDLRRRRRWRPRHRAA